MMRGNIRQTVTRAHVGNVWPIVGDATYRGGQYNGARRRLSPVDDGRSILMCDNMLLQYQAQI